jgi:hypothetical protein
VSTLPRDPLTGTDRLLIDGTNLLHALSRKPGAAPQAALIGRLRAIVPAAVGIELVFDGAPDSGMRGERIAAGLIVRHAGRRTADDVLLSLVDETRAVAGAAAAAALLVVSDDHALRASLRAKGARTAGSKWLLGRLERPKLSAPSVGNRHPARGGPPHGGHDKDGAASAAASDVAGPRWKPGRGATTKKGNPRRGRPSSGSMPT